MTASVTAVEEGVRVLVPDLVGRFLELGFSDRRRRDASPLPNALEHADLARASSAAGVPFHLELEIPRCRRGVTFPQQIC